MSTRTSLLTCLEPQSGGPLCLGDDWNCSTGVRHLSKLQFLVIKSQSLSLPMWLLYAVTLTGWTAFLLVDSKFSRVEKWKLPRFLRAWVHNCHIAMSIVLYWLSQLTGSAQIQGEGTIKDCEYWEASNGYYQCNRPALVSSCISQSCRKFPPLIVLDKPTMFINISSIYH